MELLHFRQHLEHLVIGHETARIGDACIYNHAVLINDEPRTLRAQITGNFCGIVGGRCIVVKHAVGARNLATCITQQRVFKAELFAPCLVGVVEIDTDAQDLGICRLELGKIQLKGERFLRSSVGEGADVEEQHDILLAGEIGELDFLAGARRRCKLRRLVADLDRRRRSRKQRGPCDQQSCSDLP